MNVVVLSELGQRREHVAWSLFHDFEDALVSTCNAKIFYPEAPKATQALKIFHRIQSRLTKSWYKIPELPISAKGPNVLLLLSMGPGFLLSVFGVEEILKKFDYCLAYVDDAFLPSYIAPYVLDKIDYLFVGIAELARDIQNELKISVGFIPSAVDALNNSSCSLNRNIDVLNYGRTQQDVHTVLQSYFNQPNTDFFYFHSTFKGAHISNSREHRMLMWKLLRHSKISMCFEASNVARFQGYSPFLLRWAEGFAGGCAIVGRRPYGEGVAELLDWEDSTFELPEASEDWLPFILNLLEDKERLRAVSLRNYRHALLKHDWRYRIVTMLKAVNLPIPDALKAEIQCLQERALRAI